MKGDLWVVLFLVAGCADPATQEPSDGEYILAENSVNVSEETISKLDASVITPESLLFRNIELDPEEYSPGTIMAIQPNSLLRNGSLRKILSIDRVNGDTVVHTEPAALTEYVEEAEFEISGVIEPRGMHYTLDSKSYFEQTEIVNSTNSLRLHRGSSMLSRSSVVGGGCATQGGLSYIEVFDFELESGLNLDGCISFNMIFRVTGSIKGGVIKDLSIIVHGVQKSDIEITSTLISSGFKKEYTVLSIPMGAILAGPVVIAPEVDLVVGLDGELMVGFTAAAANEIETSIGTKYENGWEPLYSYETDYGYLAPNLSGTASGSIYAGPEVNFLVYDALGFGATAHGYVAVEADIAEDPWWQVYGGFRAGLQVVGEVWDHNLFTYQIPDLVDYSISLAKAEGGYLE